MLGGHPISHPAGEEIAVNYKLHKVDGDWMVYDVVIEEHQPGE